MSTAAKAYVACPYVIAGVAIAAATDDAKTQSAAAQVAPAVISTYTALQAGQIVDVQSAGAERDMHAAGIIMPEHRIGESR
ncbi:hypothetical protein [Chelatococcus reniformis]|uniref:Uncharacterized protein n=1 Tax=Chelatococcus reniformis TaxID=1494448 RepID=A0A916UYC0_9HYPH|nr:hypothetical protein [Chelatococcus reniformis]GGC91345.1 hypothetical protein GCM10010994_56370 [Chelatococcus reniformis]